jgi:hypothetical protein
LSENLEPPSLAATSRGWECIPGVIRDNGTDTFVLEVDVKEPVTSVQVTAIEPWVVPPPSLLFRDDGLGGDRIANDFIFTSGAFRYNTSFPSPEWFYLGNADSPDGLNYRPFGRVLITELDMTVTEFQIPQQVGFLRSNVPLTTVTTVTPTIAATPHLINIQTSGRETHAVFVTSVVMRASSRFQSMRSFRTPRTCSSSSRPTKSRSSLV